MAILLGTALLAVGVWTQDTSLRVVVNIPAYEAAVIESGTVVARYPVAVGQPAYPTPTGEFLVRRLEVNPAWTPPASPWAEKLNPMPPGPANPMGRVKLELRPLYFMHGTPDSASLGSAASHGCIRMANHDALSLAATMMRLSWPGLDDSSLAALLAPARRTSAILLTRPVPVSIRYEPLEIDGDSVRVYRDVYAQWRGEAVAEVRARLAAALAPRTLAPDALARLAAIARRVPAGRPRVLPLHALAAPSATSSPAPGGLQ